MRFLFVLLSIFGLAATSAASARAGLDPGAVEQAFFVTRHEGAVVAVERVTRSAGLVLGRMTLNSELDVGWTLAVSQAQEVSSYELSTRASEEPEQTLRGKVSPAQQEVGENASGADVGAMLADGVLFDQSIGMIEQLVRSARASGARSLSVQRIIGRHPLVATVSFPTEDRARIELGGRTYDLAVDAIGRITAGQITDFGITIERVESAPETHFALRPRFAAPVGAPYTAEDVLIPAGEGRVLGGTLTIPKQLSGPVPTVVLITGLTQHDRNNGNAPSFRQLADAYARKGVAVLRVDDRGVGASTGDATTSTTQDEAADVGAALAYLRVREGIDAERLGLVGYSEGGLIAMMVAAQEPSLRAVVGLAAPASGLAAAEYQLQYILEKDGSVPMGQRDAIVQSELAGERAKPREGSFLQLDGAAFASRVRAPVLLVEGTTDRHVPPWAASELTAALHVGGNPDVTTYLALGLNHLLLPDPDGRQSGWLFLPSFSLAPSVINVIVDWTASRLLSR
jgi:hypothetical protein